jgi:chaperone BCS1
MGLSTSLFNFLFSYSYFFDSFKLLALGSIIETGRRISRWLFDRFRIRTISSFIAYCCSSLYAEYCVTAQFEEGDPAYEWIIHFLVRATSLSISDILEKKM